MRLWFDPSLTHEAFIYEIELGYRAAFALYHHDDVLFNGWC
jgi:hypothetical protein